MQSKFNFILNERIGLPFTYNESKIVVIPRDTDVFFIYWDISELTKKDLCDKGIVCNIFIRVRNLNSEKYSYIFHPEHFTKDWYFDISYTELDRNSIISDIGVYDNSGNFLVLASSNVINLPNKFYFGKDYNYWQKKKGKHNNLKSKNHTGMLYSIQNINSNEFYNFNSGTFMKSVKR